MLRNRSSIVYVIRLYVLSMKWVLHSMNITHCKVNNRGLGMIAYELQCKQKLSLNQVQT